MRRQSTNVLRRRVSTPANVTTESTNSIAHARLVTKASGVRLSGTSARAVRARTGASVSTCSPATSVSVDGGSQVG